MDSNVIYRLKKTFFFVTHPKHNLQSFSFDWVSITITYRAVCVNIYIHIFFFLWFSQCLLEDATTFVYIYINNVHVYRFLNKYIYIYIYIYIQYMQYNVSYGHLNSCSIIFPGKVQTIHWGSDEQSAFYVVSLAILRGHQNLRITN